MDENNNYNNYYPYYQGYGMVMSSSDSSEEDVIAQLELQRREAAMVIHSEGEKIPKRVIHRRREEGHANLWRDYFADDCIYTDAQFRRRFRMRRGLFDRVLEGVVESDNYFVQRTDATGRLGLSTHQKMVAALRMLAFGVSADIWGEYLAIGGSTVLAIVQKFCIAVLNQFGQTYLRRPTKVDVKRLYEENEPRGFPGMLGSIDCMHWKWKNCPTAWQGQHKGHADGATLILEAVASYDTWIWSAFFGMPGSCNDLNVLHRSTVFHELLHGKAPVMPYTVNNHRYKHGYYLADGIYPPLATIVQAIRIPTNNAEREFKRRQEACRKDVERAFGILQARWGFIREPTRLWDKDKINEVMKTCIVLHNMIVEDERRNVGWQNEYEQYVRSVNSEGHEIVELIDGNSRGVTRGESSNTNNDPEPELIPNDPNETQFQRSYELDRELRDQTVHYKLQRDLVALNWNLYTEGLNIN